MAEKVNRLRAIKMFFEDGPSGRPVTREELIKLTEEDREELARECAKAMGVEIGP